MSDKARQLFAQGESKREIVQRAKELGVKLTRTWAGAPMTKQRIYSNCGACSVHRAQGCGKCNPWPANSLWCQECQNAAVALYGSYAGETMRDETKKEAIVELYKQKRTARCDKLGEKGAKKLQKRCKCYTQWLKAEQPEGNM